MTLRFQLDEHIPHVVEHQLTLRGIDVVTAEISGLLNTPDSAILEHARINRHVVVTYDADDASLHRRGVPHAGIAYFPRAPMDAGVVVRTLELLDGVYALDDFENWLEYL